MFSCLTSARFNMTATVLNQGATEPDVVGGRWEEKQDPDSGEIIRVWVVDSDPDTPDVQERKVACIVRGILDGGIRVAGTTERYTAAGVYDNIDFAKMSFPAGESISKRDRITNIKNRDGVIVWKEEEFNGAPTVFEVLGVTPVVDPFGTHIENTALLQRAEIQ